jgi:bis(5'-adenosyl)-triphosphatase
MPTVYLTRVDTPSMWLEGAMTLSSSSPGLHTVAEHLLGARIFNDFAAYQFGSHLIGQRQVFFTSRHTIAFTNIRPVLSGHVLVVPRRHATRYTDLAPDELEDLSSVVQLVGETLEAHYKASSLTITVQDGPAAGQTVDHVHVHVLPRWDDDLPYAQKDDVYTHIDTSEQSQIHRSGSHSLAVDPFPHDKAKREMVSPTLRTRFDVKSPPPLRTLADMEAEAEVYRELLRSMQNPEFQTSSAL